MQSAKSASTPLPVNFRLSQRTCPTSGPEGEIYLIYLCVIKSDILYLHFSCSVRFTLRKRWPQGGNLYGAAERLRGIRPRPSTLPTQEESIRPETGPSTMVQKVPRLHLVGRPIQEQWGPLLLHQHISRWVSHLHGRHATFRSTCRRAHQTRSETTVEVFHEGSRAGKTHTRHED